MSILVELDGIVYDMEAPDQGLIVLLDRDSKKVLLTINEAPVMITEVISDDVYPDMTAPFLDMNSQIKDVVQIIHTTALTRILAQLRHTEHLVKVVPIKNKKIGAHNTIKIDFGILTTAMRKRD